MDQEEGKGEGGSDLLDKVSGLWLTTAAAVIDKINSFIGHLISKPVSGVP